VTFGNWLIFGLLAISCQKLGIFGILFLSIKKISNNREEKRLFTIQMVKKVLKV